MTDTNKKLLKLFIRIAVTSGLLIWVFHRIDRQQLVEALKEARWHFLIAVWILIAAIYWIESIKLRLILKKQGCVLHNTVIFRASAIAAFYSMIMPGMLSMGLKWYILKKRTGKGTNVLAGMAYNQFSSIVTMTIFALVTLIVTNPAAIGMTHSKRGQLLLVFCGIFLLAIVLFCLLLLNRRTGSNIINKIGYLLKPLPESIRQKARLSLEQIALFQVVGWRFHLLMVLITSVGILVGGMVMYMFAAKAANIIVPLWVFVWLWPVVYILQRVPISIANLGVREATLATILPLYGAAPSKAVMMSMVLFSALVFMAVIGAVFNFCGFMTGVRSNETV
jgi:uncharacterized membrane protein YbhN (UPF0104 family)